MAVGAVGAGQGKAPTSAGLGSGKSFVAAFSSGQNIPVLDSNLKNTCQHRSGFLLIIVSSILSKARGFLPLNYTF